MGEQAITLQEYLGYATLAEAQAFLIGCIIGYLFVAFFSFKFVKVEIVLSGIVSGYVLGADTIAVALGDRIPASAGPILGIVLAIFFGLIAIKLYKAIIYLCGAVMGACIGYIIPYFLFLQFELDVVGIIVGVILAIVCAIIGAKLLMKCFKPYYIVMTSLVGMVSALECLAMLIFPLDSPVALPMIIVGLVLSVFAMKAQFKMNKGKTL